MKLSRRRIFTGAGLALAGGAAWLSFGGRSANAYYNGPVSDHFDGRIFYNRGAEGPKSFGEFLRWNLIESSEAWPDSFPSPHAPPPAALLQDRLDDRVRVVAIGHASFLVQAQGHNILFDPVWSERVSPVSFAGPRRLNVPGIAFDDLPRIDTIVVTHNHYDHMDVATLARLWSKFRPRIVTPLGNDAILTSALLGGALRSPPSGLRMDAVDWGQTVELSKTLKLHAVPSLHWSARGMRDRRHALWASFVLETPAHRLYCVGDTGFGDGTLFRSIQEKFGAVDMALLPIGAYEPRWFMKSQHMNPADAVAAFELLGAKQALGHHWGTFKLTNEGIERPAQDLRLALADKGIDPARFVAARPGAVFDVV
jgi:L-ascorbate metabolism protein UlaG (beta-lactamase superfamily)